MTDVAGVPSGPRELSGRSLVESAWWMTGSHLLAQAFAYGSLIYLARLLPPAAFGTIALGAAVVYIAALGVDSGTYGGIIVHPGLTRADLVRAFWRCLLVAVVLAGLMVATAGPLVHTFAEGGDSAAYAALAVCLPLYAVSVIPTALLHKSMQFRRLAGATAVANVVSAIAAVVAGLAGLGVWALAARPIVLFALLAVLTTVLCLPELRERSAGRDLAPAATRPPTANRWFLIFGVTLVLTTNLDYLVIGNSGDANLVGLYALAFTIAMAPSTHFSEQIGKVLFAAAASSPETSRERTELSVRLMSMLLLPLLPVGIVIAPVALPAVLGSQWLPMVVAFQLLFVVGVGHAVVNCIGEALSGTGEIAFRAKVMVVRCIATLLALLILVRVGGITGAALAQLAVFAPYAVVYSTAGLRRAGTTPTAVWRGLRPVVAAFAVQVAVTCVVVLALRAAGASEPVAAGAAAVAGLAAAGPALFRLFARVRSA